MIIANKTGRIGLAIFTVFVGGALYLIDNRTEPPPAKAQTIQSTREQQARGAQCEAALKKSRIRTYQWADGHATIVVGDAFYAASFDDKAALNTLVRCAATEGRMDASLASVEYLDSRTHQSVARWSPYTGLKVK